MKLQNIINLAHTDSMRREASYSQRDIQFVAGFHISQIIV